MPPPFFFHAFAASSSTFSASPSSLHLEPQCFPINVASNWRADDVRVRLCFFVKVRNARGRKVGGARRTGNVEGLDDPAAFVVWRIGWMGVPKACEDEGTGSESKASLLVGLNRRATLGFSMTSNPEFYRRTIAPGDQSIAWHFVEDASLFRV